jgi:hypothetical protein
MLKSEAHENAIAVVLGGRRIGSGERLLGGAHHRDHAEAADALLHRGQ